MRVREWQDILEDVVESSTDSEGWRAVAGRRRTGVGEDLFLGHPNAGVYQLKTYAKNPYDLKGVGARVARRVDEDIDPLLPNREAGGRFALRRPPEDEAAAESMAKQLEETVKVHADAPTTPDDFFTDVMDALDSPAFGPMRYGFDGRPERLDSLSETFEDADELLTAELDDLIDDDEIGRGFQ
ncbi:hypothetical protein ACNS7O_00880 [Haloferacaceae archaeon DSL9]